MLWWTYCFCFMLLGIDNKLSKISLTQCVDGPVTWNIAWWRHQMEIFSALLAICAGNSLVTGEFPTQRPVTRSFDVFFDLRLNKRLSKQWWGWWFETLSRPLWRHLEHWIRVIDSLFGMKSSFYLAQTPQYIKQISPIDPFCNRNVHTCAYFCYKMVPCGFIV